MNKMTNPSHLIANRFELHDLLGRGGMGEVYRATDVQTGETVAVKALDPAVLEREPGLLERFMREGEALRLLNHPNIVHMFAIWKKRDAITSSWNLSRAARSKRR
jgi:serine/threonine-protein kinase